MTTNKLYAAMFYLYVIHVDISKEQGLQTGERVDCFMLYINFTEKGMSPKRNLENTCTRIDMTYIYIVN